MKFPEGESERGDEDVAASTGPDWLRFGRCGSGDGSIDVKKPTRRTLGTARGTRRGSMEDVF